MWADTRTSSRWTAPAASRRCSPRDGIEAASSVRLQVNSSFSLFAGAGSMAELQSAPPAGDAGTLVQFSIEKIYVKDLSLENPGAPQSFQMTEAPQIEIGLRTRGEQIAADTYECVLILTVTARAGDKTVFLIEASQAGVFGIRGVGADQLQPVLAIHCPTVLFPYARETVADATMRSGFPPVQLAPINFDLLYQQQLAQVQQAPAGATANAVPN